MISLILPAATPPTDTARTGDAPQKPLSGPVLMADILTAPGGRPSLLTLWAQWDERERY